MRATTLLIGFGVGFGVLMVAGCASDQRDWMKINTPYTVEEFRRDYAECSRKGKLDEECMRSRGWVDVSREAEKAPPAAPDRGRMSPPRQRY